MKLPFRRKAKAPENPPSPTPPPVDPDATAVHSGWGSMLQEHIKAQSTAPESSRSTSVPADSSRSTDGVRHGPQSSSIPQRPLPSFPKNDEPSEQRGYARIARPPAGYQFPQYTSEFTQQRTPITHPTQQNPNIQHSNPNVQHSNPSQNQGQGSRRPADDPRSTSVPDPTDLTQIMQKVQEQQPMQERRVLHYYGHGNIIQTVVAYQVISSNTHGVLIVENGFEGARKLIPWRRVHELVADHNDSILNPS